MTHSPFIDSFVQADLMGKVIFLSLIITSVVSWFLLIYKIRLERDQKAKSKAFRKEFSGKRSSPLGLELSAPNNPFARVYTSLKKQTLELLNKNKHFSQQGSLSPADIDFVQTHVTSTINSEVEKLEKHLFILSTIVTLAPFLGLLGTVWGILTTFSDMQTGSGGGSHQMVLGGLSLALTTTVMGLIVAIPALIGYNYLKTQVFNFHTAMENFAGEVMAAVELQYRQVDIT